MPRPPIQSDRAEYTLKSVDELAHHTTQVAIDKNGDFAIMTYDDPTTVALKLRLIGRHIEQDLKERNRA